MLRQIRLALACLVVGLFPAVAPASIIVFLEDPQDDRAVIQKIQDDPQVVGFRTQVEVLRKRLLQWRERDFRALFGKPIAPVKAQYAMVSTEARLLGLSGLRYADPKLNKDHIDSHSIGNVGRLDVYYGIDGTTPVHVHFYLKVDKGFVKLDRVKNLNKRVRWELERYRKLVRLVEQRWRQVVVWEVDAEKQKAQFEGMNSGDFAVKLQAMIRWGKRQGYRLDYQPARGDQTPSWRWFLGEKKTAEAIHNRGFKGAEGKPCYFAIYRPDGTCLRDDGGWPALDMVRWTHPDGTLLRTEHGSLRNGTWQPTAWGWYDRKGKVVRNEWDSNGDGVPDMCSIRGPSGKMVSQPLAVEHSWAVHPELIPAEVSIPDQSARRVPLRKIKE